MLGFLGLSKIQLVASAVVVSLLLGVAGVLFIQNKSLRSDLQQSEANVATAKAALAQQSEAVEAAQANARQWQLAFDGMQRRMEELTNVQEQAAAETRRLNAIFGRHDLTALARAKPGLIERRINAGTADVFGVLERISAGDLHEADGAGAPTGAPASPQPSPD